VVPRGGAGLIERVRREAHAPVIETGVGNCHVYVDGAADLDMAEAIVVDAKVDNPAVCNGSVSNYTTSGGADVLLPDKSAIHAVVQSTFPAVLEHMKDTAVQVYNGTGRSGPATFYTQVLQGMGAVTEPPAPAPASAGGYPQTEVFVNRSVLRQTPALAYILAESLGARLGVASFPTTKAGVVVILGQNFPPVGS